MRLRTVILGSVLALAACKKDKKDDGGGGGGGGGGGTPAAKLAELDLSKVGEAYAGWKMMAPEGAIAKDDFGNLAVEAGDGFQLQVEEGATDMAAQKKDIESNDVNQFKKYITNTADTLVYESDPGIGGKQVHFIAAVKIGGADYYCENKKGPIYNQAQTEAMVAACKSIKK